MTTSYNWNNMAQDQQQSADALFFQADELIRQQQFAEAKETLERTIAADASHGRAYNHLGWLYERKYRDYAKAADMYEKALEHAPEYPAIYLNYAVVLSDTGNYSRLAEILDKALTIPGMDKGRIYNEQGLMAEQQAKYDEAIDWYKKAIAAAKNVDDIKSYKGNIALCEEKKAL